MSHTAYRTKREQLGYTQAELASLLGLPRTAIVKREAGAQRITREAELALGALPRKPKRARNATP